MPPEITPWIDPATVRPRTRWHLRITLPVLLVLVNIAGLCAFVHVQFRHARVRANVRACVANMKTVAGALEMYNLDHELAGAKDRGRPLAREKMEEMRQSGYLRSIPADPGFGGEASFTVEPDGQLRCPVHGTVERPVVPEFPLIPEWSRP